MSTRAEIQALIDTDLADSSNITATEHRNVLADDSDSILENIYMTPVTETQVSNTITTNNAYYDYNVNFTKTGRNVHITGSVTSKDNNALFLAPIFAISDSEYQTSYIAFGSGVTDAGETMRIGLSSNNLIMYNVLFANETMYINITYQVTS